MTDYYAGEYRSAIARAKRVLVKAGFAWSRILGRYPNQKVIPGVVVHRVGVSDTVMLHIRDVDHAYTAEKRAARRELELRALKTLREAGLPFDDRGMLECGTRRRP